MKTIAEIAKEAGFKASLGKTDKDGKYHPYVNALGKDIPIEWLERFAELVRADECEPLSDERIESVRHMRDVQGYDGNWNYDPYMQGLYNGLEFALSLLEVREPQFKSSPEKWLGDIKVKRDKLSRGAASGIKENT